jgi:excisionase family DNA binding protein
MDREKYLTLREVAEILKLDPHTVRRYAAKGIIKATKMGMRWRIPESEAYRILQEGWDTKSARVMS